MLGVFSFYGLFLRVNRASTIATTMIRTNSPAIAGIKYRSAAEIGAAVGFAVGVNGTPYARAVCPV